MHPLTSYLSFLALSDQDPMLIHQWRKYLSPLARVLGPRAASQELRWMMQTVHQHPPPDPPPRAQDLHARLETMVQRRVSGEPLQYILGPYKNS